MAYIDTMVTLVDASSLINDYHSDDFLQHRGQALSEEDERSVVNLLVDQIEFANVIIVNKVNRVDADELEMAESIIKALSSDVVLIKSTHGIVELKSILDTKIFDGEKAAQSAGWANINAITKTLDKCLLSDEEVASGKESWTHFPDPFSHWAFIEN